MIVNEAFVRGFVQRGIASPLGARLRYSSESGVSAAEPSFEVVGVVRDLGLDPDEEGEATPYVFHAASAATVSPLVMSVRLCGNPATLAARLPTERPARSGVLASPTRWQESDEVAGARNDGPADRRGEGPARNRLELGVIPC